jgi:hypothetical protein
MCVATGCRKIVVGRRIFAHCEEHLDKHEQDWLKEEIETQIAEGRWPKPKSTDCLTKAFEETFQEQDKEFMQERISRKEAALTAAYNLVNQADAQRLERRA